MKPRVFSRHRARNLGWISFRQRFGLIKWGVNERFDVSVLEAHRDNLDIIGTLDLLPFNGWYLVGVWIVGLFATVMVATTHLYLMPLRHETAPSELLQS